MIGNNKYYIDLINSSKAYSFVSAYHYSGVGFKKAILNQGVYRKEDNKLVGVLQWGCSFQEAIKLNRYVKEDIKKEEYLELNRFCMDDEEGKNSESQAISLGIKWIKLNRPEIKLLVSYAGRKEGNYGYIYQATNWEYLGYFISGGFWLVDGEERHQITLWYRHKKYGKPNYTMLENLCDMYNDVRQIWSKQFIYVKRLDNKLTLATEKLSYPKVSNEFPIQTNVKIYKENNKVFNDYCKKEKNKPIYYYEKEDNLFTRQTLIRRGEIFSRKDYKIAIYNLEGNLERTAKNVKEIENENYKAAGIRKSLRTNKRYKDKYFRHYISIPEEEIETEYICIIDEIPFYTYIAAAEYLGVSKQAVQQSHKRLSKKINKKEIIWFIDKK